MPPAKSKAVALTLPCRPTGIPKGPFEGAKNRGGTGTLSQGRKTPKNSNEGGKGEDKEEVRPFRANLQRMSPRRAKDAARMPPTRPSPFSFLTELRGQCRKEKIRQQLEEQRKKDKVRRHAAIRPAPSHTVPFAPKKSTKPLTLPIGAPQLHTEIRMQQRHGFAARLQLRAEENARLAGELKRQKDELDKEALEELRERLVHRPEPIRTYGRIIVRPSKQPLTAPQSPKLQTRLRSRRRQREDE